ncbi:MAG: exodeoxyribonuclease VII small subunit [Eubacterium sp.]|nr:exodeoxyribonuclease VII small subunit [Eubacterium sp.]
MATKKQPELDEIMRELEAKVTRLENEPLSLEESYKEFSEGMELVKQGNATIDRVEKELKILMDDE